MCASWLAAMVLLSTSTRPWPGRRCYCRSAGALFDGIEGANSISWNPHKWLGSVLETSLFYVRQPELLVSVMATDPSYLRSTLDGSVVQYRDWGLPLGRRFRALRLWALLTPRRRGRSPRPAAPGPGQCSALRRSGRSGAGLDRSGPGQIANRMRPAHARLTVPMVDSTSTPWSWCEAVNASGLAHVTPAHSRRPLDGTGLDRCRADRVGRRGSALGIDAGKGRPSLNEAP